MNAILVVAPHPDDETLGCGGTLLRHVAEGDPVHWLIATSMTEDVGYTSAEVARRRAQIAKVADGFGFTAVHELGFPTTYLDTVPLVDLVSAIGEVIQEIEPVTLYLPYGGDAHSDHGITFKAAQACTKWFRYPSIRHCYCYETLSETDFALPSAGPGMLINRYVDISAYIDKKLEIVSYYDDETAEHPFPRSQTTVKALGELRGAAAGCMAAEAFQTLKEIV